MRNFDKFTFPISTELDDSFNLKRLKETEGKITAIEYELPDGVTAYQVFRSYTKLIERKGATVIFSCENEACDQLKVKYVRQILPGSGSSMRNAAINSPGGYMISKMNYEGKPFLISLVVAENKSDQKALYRLDFVEEEKLEEGKISMADLSAGLERDGKMVFYAIEFEFDKSTLKPTSAEPIQTIATYLNENENVEILIVGHTDNKGDLAYNQKLSSQRADAVVAELTSKHGIAEKRLMPIGVGMASPVSSNTTEERKQKNRRVEIVLR